MRSQAVHDYVKKKRGLCAAGGGEVPDDADGYYDSDSKTWVAQQPQGEMLADNDPPKAGNPVDDAQTGADDAPEEPEAADAPAEAPAAAPEAAPSKEQQIRDYLKSRYEHATDDSAVKAAVADRDHKNFVASLGEGLTRMAGARSAGALDEKPDYSGPSKALRAQGEQGVQQAQEARKQQIQGFLQQNQMARQVAQDQMAKGTYENQQKAAKFLQDRQDPNSPYSKSMQGQFKNLWGPLLGDTDVSGLSAAQMDDMSKQYEKKAGMEANEKIAQAKIDGNKEIAKGRQQAHADFVAGENARKAEAEDAKATAKTGETQRKSFLEMENKGMGGRGSPQYISKNMVTQQSIANAQKMLAEAPKDPVTGEPDYNKLSDKQVHLFNGELEKIATNGAPTESGRQAMEADTLASNIAAFKQKFGGKPTPAQVGEFVRDNAKYLQGLKETVDASVNKFRRDNFDNYYTAGAISDEHAEKYKKKHPELFPEEQQDAKPKRQPPQATAAVGSGEAQAAPAGPQLVKIQSPSGAVMSVPAERAEYYVKKGGKVVP